jgi:hypothetical protein
MTNTWTNTDIPRGARLPVRPDGHPAGGLFPGWGPRF